MTGFILRALIAALGLWLGAASFAALIVSVTGWLASWLTEPRGGLEAIVCRVSRGTFQISPRSANEMHVPAPMTM